MHELCCYPLPKAGKVGQLPIQENGFTPCWNENRNVSRCCRPRGSFFRISRAIPSRLKGLLQGCDAPTWQNFIFKVRMTSGILLSLDTKETNWFRYYGLPMSRRKVAGSCVIGGAIHRILWDYLSLDVSADSGEALDVLTFADAQLRPWGGLFNAFGMTLEQLRFIRSLQLLQNYYTNQPVRRKFKLQQFPSKFTTGAPLAFDFGASGGLDTEFYLHSGLRVVSVEGNVQALRKLRSRLRRFEDRRNLTLVHAVAGASSAPEVAKFRVDEHQPEVSGLWDGRSTEDAKVEVVPRRACGALYSQFARRSRRSRSEYVKIDLEGMDVPCLESLLRNTSGPHRAQPQAALRGKASNSSAKFRPLAPKFVSIELPRPYSSDLVETKALETANMLRGLLRGRYCAAKLCRQHIYNIRYVEGLGVLSRHGLGSSGLFGNAAVDWRVGEEWRPLEAVLAEMPQAGMLGLLSLDWFDLHLRHC